MNSFEIKVITKNSIPVLQVSGYFSADSGTKLEEIVEGLLQKGSLFMVVDFSNCKLINSPGVYVLMETAMKIVDDYCGRILLCGLDELKLSVFTMAGVFLFAEVAKTCEEAVQNIKQVPAPSTVKKILKM
ncbi:MAG: STAS domain-containing protein [Candidatus Riflebacteria bacterium]|nr:STAS domain-containing protein [Candidatus Riflebacteria bacterium]